MLEYEASTIALDSSNCHLLFSQSSSLLLFALSSADSKLFKLRPLSVVFSISGTMVSVASFHVTGFEFVPFLNIYFCKKSPLLIVFDML